MVCTGGCIYSMYVYSILQLTNCLVNLANGLPTEKKSVLVEYLRKRLLEDKLKLSHQLRDGAVNVDQLHLKLLVAGYVTLNKTGLLKPTVKVTVVYCIICTQVYLRTCAVCVSPGI